MVKDTHSRQLELLLTEHCSLCDEALNILLSDVNLRGWRLVTRDVVLDDELLARFGERIPVLRSGSQVLCWPFDAAAIQAWLSAAHQSPSPS